MTSSHWCITKQHGLLSAVQPEIAWQTIDNSLPSSLQPILADVNRGKSLHAILLDYSLDNIVEPICLDDNETNLELVFMLYGYLACAWVGMGNSIIPSAISQTLVTLAEKLDRPPMLAYAGMVLNNWRLKDEALGFIPQNIAIRLRFTDLIDESWFFQVHIAIEAQAGQMLRALIDVQEAIECDDMQQVLIYLRHMQRGLVQITKTFHEMPKLCDPDIYYQKIRPYLMSFDDTIIFEGIQPNPTPLRGGSGAQSSIVPVMLAGLGIDHQSSQLTANLKDMQRYMPREHRQLIDDMHHSTLRDYCQQHPPLRDAYNHVLRQLITFRRAHLYYARTYIFEKSTNPIGTGGTEYMSFLSKLIDETAKQLL